MPFANRRDAGRQLAVHLSNLKEYTPVVLGLPRGGVPVAAEIAARLRAPLDVLVVRKVGCPWQPELGMGAIGEGGVRVLNQNLIAQLGITDEEVEAVASREQAEVERRVRAYRAGRPPVPVTGRTVIVVDDGLATGFTARAAIQMVRRLGAARVVLAVPVAPPDAVEALREIADEVVCLETPTWFLAIGAWYQDFRQTTDEEVQHLLAEVVTEVPAGVAATSDATSDADPAREVKVTAEGVSLPGNLSVPDHAVGAVIFAHGSGSSRFSPRNTAVATQLNGLGLATLLFDLLTPAEERDRANVFDIPLLGHRLAHATRWLRRQSEVAGLAIGYFGASTGAAAALLAASERGGDVSAVVSRGGRPDLAGPALAAVSAPTLLIVGGRDDVVLELNRQAQMRLRCEARLEVIPGAGHLFEEPGALDAVAGVAGQWFLTHLRSPGAASGPP
jgi:putative phosphoribosyl transferase